MRYIGRGRVFIWGKKVKGELLVVWVDEVFLSGG